ncbi:MAG TPA: alpha/beta hydrolase [Candidatus Kryptonia bacterium]|nr:alpha/beta hydrolase [Candidatus Kryptonia bacterium]
MLELTRDGVRLCYDEAGKGSALLFVHGWCCDHTYFAPQFEHFRSAHRVVSVDLRGHGGSDKPRQDYTMAGFAEDLAWLCRELRIDKPVVIGHSMGGVIALALAERFPDVPAAIASLDSPILAPPATTEAVRPLIEALRGPDYRKAQRLFLADLLFGPADDPVRKTRILDDMSSAPQHVMVSAFENIFAFDHAKAAAACRVPWLALYATQPVSDLVQLRQACPQVVVGQTVGAGHFHQLEVPDQINAMLARFLATTAQWAILRDRQP